MCDKRKVDIAIIGAMSEEVDALAIHLTKPVKYEALNSVYYLGKLCGHEVVIFQSGIGKVGAAISTTFVLEHFSPDYLINIGSAGGFDSRLSVGDIIISTEVCYHDVDVSMIGCEYGQVPNLPVAFKANSQLVALANQAAKKIIGHKAFDGLVCTGDFFMSGAQSIALVRSHFPSVLAVDMEAAAIGHTCYLYNCPFVVVRAISDLVDNPSNNLDFYSFLAVAAKNSAHLVIDILKQL